MTKPLQLWDYQRPLRLTVDEFLHMADAGAFARFTRTELIEGEILTMNAQYSQHGGAKSALAYSLTQWCEAGGFVNEVMTDTTVRIEPASAPEPDIVLTSFEERTDAAIPADTVLLAVEVSATTLEIDLGRKARLYATAGIPEYWVVDLDNRLVRQFWSPAGSAYPDHRETPFGQPIEAATIAGLVVPTVRLC